MSKAPRAWQRMLSGRRLDLLDPSPFDIEISDIALGLARVARWNGQTRGDDPFSVAEHSLLVESLARALKPGLPPACRMAALLHDAPEYVIGDLISPFKAMIGGDYKTLEERLLTAIMVRFGLSATPKADTQRLIKKADKAAAFLEAVTFEIFDQAEAAKIFGRPKQIDLAGFRLAPLGAKRAEDAFLHRFEEISSALEGGAAAR